MASTTVFAAPTNTSQQKQVVYTRYALGELSMEEATRAIAAIAPPRPTLPRAYRIAKFLVVLLAASVLPTWATRRADDES